MVFLFIFITLVLVCFNIVSLLLLKQKSGQLKDPAAIAFNKINAGLTATGQNSRKSFWSTVSTNLSFLSLGKSN